MANKIASLLPHTANLLEQLGERLRIARLRRRISAKQVAERAGMAPMTLRSLERGGAGVTMGAYLAVMQVLGVENDVELLAKEDVMGRSLQDARLEATVRKKKPGSSPAVMPKPETPAARSEPRPRAVKPLKASEKMHTLPDEQQAWIEEQGFTSSESFAGLFKPVARAKKER